MNVKRPLSWALAAAMAAGPAAAAAVPESPAAAALQDAFAEVAQAIKPSVVSITAVHVENVAVAPPEFYFGDPFEDFFNQQFQGRGSAPQRPAPRKFQRRFEGLGSGVVVDERGYVLTNEHVVRGATELTVTFPAPEEKKYTAKVVGADPRTDLAVIKVEGKGKFPAAVLGDSARVRVGEWAIAVGSPFGLEQTVTVGVISAVRQSLVVEGTVYADMLQTDAAINRGNSGGPLVNLKGEVIGINSAIYAPTWVFAGIGFAIPSDRARDIMAQLIEKGRVVRSWLGVEVMPLDEVLSRRFEVKDGKGVLVNAVTAGSPAEAAGIKRGDVILELNGRPIAEPGALLDAVGRTPPKSKVDVKIWRAKQELVVHLTTGEAPSGAAAVEGEEGGEEPQGPIETGAAAWEGARLVKSSPALAGRFGFPSGSEGVVAVSVEPGGLAAAAGLVEGDLVASVNGIETPDPKTFLAAAKSADARQGLVFDVCRRGRWIYLTFKAP